MAAICDGIAAFQNICWEVFMKIVLQTISVAMMCVGVFTTRAFAQDLMSKSEPLAILPGSIVRSISNQDDKTRWAQAYSTGRKKLTCR
jgi:hypothetical protein